MIDLKKKITDLLIRLQQNGQPLPEGHDRWEGDQHEKTHNVQHDCKHILFIQLYTI